MSDFQAFVVFVGVLLGASRWVITMGMFCDGDLKPCKTKLGLITRWVPFAWLLTAPLWLAYGVYHLVDWWIENGDRIKKAWRDLE